VARDHRWDEDCFDTLSQVAQESPISRRLSWSRAHSQANRNRLRAPELLRWRVRRGRAMLESTRWRRASVLGYIGWISLGAAACGPSGFISSPRARRPIAREVPGRSGSRADAEPTGRLASRFSQGIDDRTKDGPRCWPNFGTLRPEESRATTPASISFIRFPSLERDDKTAPRCRAGKSFSSRHPCPTAAGSPMVRSPECRLAVH
jgi:hypothetical protein